MQESGTQPGPETYTIPADVEDALAFVRTMTRGTLSASQTDGGYRDTFYQTGTAFPRGVDALLPPQQDEPSLRQITIGFMCARFTQYDEAPVPKATRRRTSIVYSLRAGEMAIERFKEVEDSSEANDKAGVTKGNPEVPSKGEMTDVVIFLQEAFPHIPLAPVVENFEYDCPYRDLDVLHMIDAIAILRRGIAERNRSDAQWLPDGWWRMENTGIPTVLLDLLGAKEKPKSNWYFDEPDDPIWAVRIPSDGEEKVEFAKIETGIADEASQCRPLLKRTVVSYTAQGFMSKRPLLRRHVTVNRLIGHDAQSIPLPQPDPGYSQELANADETAGYTVPSHEEAEWIVATLRSVFFSSFKPWQKEEYA